MTDGAPFFDASAVAYIVSFFALLIGWILQRSWFQRVGIGALAAGFLSQSFGLVLRGLALGGFPVTSTYESLVFYAWVFALGYLAMLLLGLLREQLRSMTGTAVALLAVLCMALAGSPLRSPDVVPLVPALRSHWLALHVSLVFVGEGFFAVAFVAGLAYLCASRRGSSTRRELLERLDSLSYRSIAIGFPFFTLGGLFFGMIWAKHAWGRYWGWDPKETFMLVTWLVYVLYLHVRIQRNWRGRRTAWIAVLGFILALFTFAGVNFLIRGLHSYA
jgi:cytochrome c-type biogenesis protein CcsB